MLRCCDVLRVDPTLAGPETVAGMLTPTDLREILLPRQKERTASVRRLERDFRHGDQPLEKASREQALQLENDEVLDALDDAGPSTRPSSRRVRVVLVLRGEGDNDQVSFDAAHIDAEPAASFISDE